MATISASLYEVKDKFDLVLTRLVVQHLSSVEDFLKQAHHLLKPGGTLIIIDANDPARLFYPNFLHLPSFFETFRKSRRDSGCDRDAAFLISQKAEEFDLQIKQEIKLIIPSTIPGHKTLFFKSYQTVFEIIKQDYQMDFDYAALQQEWKRWFSLPNSYAQISLSLASYERR